MADDFKPGDEVEVLRNSGRPLNRPIFGTIQKPHFSDSWWLTNLHYADGSALGYEGWAKNMRLVEPRVVVPDRDYPHVCPNRGCGAPAFVSFLTVDCTKCGGK